jgi:hypothetical protein
LYDPEVDDAGTVIVHEPLSLPAVACCEQLTYSQLENAVSEAALR